MIHQQKKENLHFIQILETAKEFSGQIIDDLLSNIKEKTHTIMVKILFTILFYIVTIILNYL